MQILTRDPDSGVMDQDCRPLSPEKVFAELAFHIQQNLTFLGRPASYWKGLIAERAQEIADEADPEEYEMWGVRYMETT